MAHAHTGAFYTIALFMSFSVSHEIVYAVKVFICTHTCDYHYLMAASHGHRYKSSL